MAAHAELWIGYARHKYSGRYKLTGNVWTKPFAACNQYAQYPPISQTATEVVYEASSWEHTEGTPKVHPNEKDWQFVLVQYAH